MWFGVAWSALASWCYFLRMKRTIRFSIVLFLLASASACVVEERGYRGRGPEPHGHGHAYGHAKHGR